MVCDSPTNATNPLSEPPTNHVASKAFCTLASSESFTDDEDDRVSSEDSSKSAIWKRFLNKLMEPIHPLKYSKSLPSLVPKQTDNIGFRSEALVTEGWVLERCIEGTPGRKYNVSGLIVDSDTILATRIKSGRFGVASGDCFVDQPTENDDCDDSASQTSSVDHSCVYFYLIVCILAVHFMWCLYRYCSRNLQLGI